MKKFLALLLLFAPLAARAQGPPTASNPLGGNLRIVDAGTCSTNLSFLWQRLPVNAATTTVNLAGTFSATVTVRQSNNGGASWSTAGTQSAVGTASYASGGFTDICVDVTTFVSGSVGVTISTGLNTGPQGPAGPAGSGGGFPVTTAVTVNSGGSITPTGTGSITATNLNSSTLLGDYILSPKCPTSNLNRCFFANGDVYFKTDFTLTNTSNILSSPTANFTGTDALGRIRAKAGQAIYCTTSALAGTNPLVQTTILSVDSATQIHTVGNATANQVGNGFCYWGDDDTTNIAAAWTAVGAACQAALFIDAGIYMTLKGQFQSTPAACITFSGAALANPAIRSNSVGGAIIMPFPNFDLTIGAGQSCGGSYFIGPPPGTAANSVCFGGVISEWYNVNIWGGGFRSTSGTTFNGTLFDTEGGRVEFANMIGWLDGVNNAGVTYGVLLNNSESTMRYGGSLNFGLYPFIFGTSAGTSYAYGNQIQGGINVLIADATNGVVQNSDSVIGPDNNGSPGNDILVHLGTNAAMLEIGELYIAGTTVTSNQTEVGAIAWLQECFLGGVTTYYKGIGAGSTHYILNNKHASTVTNIASMAAGASIFDQGGNYGAGWTASGGLTGAGNWFGSNSITGTVITAAKLVLSAGWGASAAWTALNGTTKLVQGTITNTGAGQAANPTITYTFPNQFTDAANVVCRAYQVGGTQAIIATTEFLTPSALTKTGVTFTYNGTPTVNLTEVMQIDCDSR